VTREEIQGSKRARPLKQLGQPVALTMAEFLRREGVPDVVSALYLSAGEDTMPFSFLSPAFLSHRGVEGFAWPQVFVYVDKRKPFGRAAGLSFQDDRGTVVQTTAVERLTVNGLPSWALDVRADARHPESSLAAKVLRIRADNQQVLPMIAKSAWTPEVVITVCDGCAMGGQEEGRCDNDLADPTSIVRYLTDAPRWWVTDHWTPRGWLPILGDGPGWEFHRVTPLSSEWGHPWLPLHGANLFRIRKRQST
jgi:hypothetical protein